MTFDFDKYDYWASETLDAMMAHSKKTGKLYYPGGSYSRAECRLLCEEKVFLTRAAHAVKHVFGGEIVDISGGEKIPDEEPAAAESQPELAEIW